ncbi:hypothetical protein [Mycoplana dimorpha]|uniref:Uncharacterized protein n=1 Tax=Mycoplana dimorpha TaxID=28320 RepID=A0A2T5B8E7_MYCDI|nr:hypothetical protein [Mycoplana dimorpha]PTM95265.1 hypothetical protein C7449_104339 [Mycoplana dimorpha]
MLDKRSLPRRLWILIWRPIAIAAWRRRNRQRFRRNFPIEWKTPGEIIGLDLQNYEQEAGFDLNKAMVDDLLPARDAALARSNRLVLTSLVIFAFLAADYFSLSVKISLPGVDVRDIKGVREFLIFFSGLLSTLSLLAQNNVYTLESTIKYIVNNHYPEQLRPIYISKYFWHENYPRYFPTRIPHLLISPIQSRLVDLISLGWLLAMFFYVILFFVIGILISIDVWKNGGISWFSRVVAFGAIANSVLGWGYFIITRCKMPYRNFLKLQEIEVLGQIAPSQVEAKWQSLYGEGYDDYVDMINRGYLPGGENDHAHLVGSKKTIRRNVVAFVLLAAFFWAAFPGYTQ